MEKRLLLAAALSLGILILWEWVVPKPARPPASSAAPPVAAATPSPAKQTAIPVLSAGAGETVSAPEESLATLENAAIRATFSNRGAVMTSLILKRYTDGQGRPLELVRASPAPRPFALAFPGNEEATRRAASALFAVEKGAGRELRFRYAEGSLGITKEVRLADAYVFDVKVAVAGLPSYTLLAGSGLRNVSAKEKTSSFIQPTTAVATVGNGFERVREDKAEEIQTWPLPERGFAGLEDNYFMAVLIPQQPSSAQVYPAAIAAAPPAVAGNAVVAGVTGSGTLAVRAYYGPKDLEILEGLNLGLERAVDLGWFGIGILARPLLLLLKWTYSWIGNYGLAILFVTLLIRIALFPLTHKSYSSMRKMQKLAPKMTAIRDKYKKSKTDAAQRAKMNQELMALYQSEGYNPMSGCFPMLLQLPILIAFYNVLSRSIELRHAPFALWIKDLSAVDHTYILVIVMIVSMYVQQAMTPSTLDPVQKKIFMAMPVIWGFFLKDMPSGLVLYWLFSNVLTIFQQMIIKKMGDKEDAKTEKPTRVKKAKAV